MKYLKTLLFFLAILFLFPKPIHAQEANVNDFKTDYYKAEVIKVLQEGEKTQGGFTSFSQTVAVKIAEGSEKGKVVQIEQGGLTSITPQQFLKSHDQVIIIKTKLPNGKTTYSLMDRYRLNNLIYILVGFFILVIFFAGKKGVGAILGLCVSLSIILGYIVPQILKGNDPILTTILGSLLIIFVSIFLAHGFSKKIIVAVAATIIALTFAGVLANWLVNLTHLSGLGSEDAGFLQIFNSVEINMRGLLLAGIIIGTLGVLDDITTAQSAAIFELYKTDRTLSFQNLVKKGYTIGREHISSLVNTLVLAYAGASLSLFILFVLNPAKQPYWVILNSEIIIEEVVRTLAGSIGLILAVPITTLLAAWVCTNKKF